MGGQSLNFKWMIVRRYVPGFRLLETYASRLGVEKEEGCRW